MSNSTPLLNTHRVSTNRYTYIITISPHECINPRKNLNRHFPSFPKTSNQSISIESVHLYISLPTKFLCTFPSTKKYPTRRFLFLRAKLSSKGMFPLVFLLSLCFSASTRHLLCLFCLLNFPSVI